MRVIDDRYHVLETVESNERSELLRVEDRLRPGRMVMLKMLRLSGEEELQSFTNDFRVRAGLRHRGIPRVFELGTDPQSGAPYYTGEWIDGRPWDEVATGAQPTLLYLLTADVCSTLAHCHARGLLHLDLKPDNLLVVSERGQLRVKVLDFGLARGRSRRAVPGGTPIYMPPELLEGKRYDGRADLYSLGISLLPPERRPDVPGYPPEQALDPDWPRPLATLVARLIERDPARRFSSARAVLGYLERAGVVPADQLRRLLETEIPFVGRGVPMMRLRDAFRRFFEADGQPERPPVRGVLLVGEPGIGKTRLMREFRATVTTKPPVVVGGDPYGEDVPCPPLGDPLARLWQRPEIREGAGAPYGRVLSAVLPGLQPPPPPGGLEPGGQEDLVRMITDFLVACVPDSAGTLFLDDLDRGDPIAPRVVRELLRRDDNRWFVVATAREADALPFCDVVELDGVGEGAIDEVLRLRFEGEELEAELTRRIHRITGGNPAFLTVLLRRLRVDPFASGSSVVTLPEPGEMDTPADLAASIQRRVAELPEEQRAPLGFLALAGRPLPLDAICMAVDVEAAETGAVLSALEDQGLVRRDGSGPAARYRVALEHHAPALAAGLGDTARGRYHSAMARWLAQAEDVDDLRDLARHLASTGDAARGAEVLLRAARRAMERFDHDRAEAVLRRVVSIAPDEAVRLRAEAQLALGDLLVHLGRYRAARDAFGEVERLDPEILGVEVRGRLARKQGALALKVGDKSLGLSLLERAASLLEGTDAHGEAAYTYELLASSSMDEDRELARHYCDLALGHVAEVSSPMDGAAIHLLSGRLAAQGGEYQVGIDDVERAVALFREAGSVRNEITAVHVLATLLQDTGQTKAAAGHSLRAAQRAEETGDRDQLATAAVVHGDSCFLLGEVAEAMTWYERARAQAVDNGHPIQEAAARMRIGRMLSTIGAPDEAQRQLERAVLLADAGNDRRTAGEARAWLAAARIRAGETEALDRLLDRATDDLRLVGSERGLQTVRLMRAAWLERQGQRDQAVEALQPLLDAGTLPEVRCTALRLRSQVERALADGDLPAAFGWAGDALSIAERIESPDHQWRSLDELAATCVALQDHERADEALRRLQELAEWIEARMPEGVEASHRIHRAVGRLSRELGVVAMPPEPARARGEDAGDDALDRLTGTIVGITTEESTVVHLRQLLATAVEVTGAERGLLRLMERTEGDEGAVPYRDLFVGEEPFPCSERMLEGVQRTGQATWTANATSDPRFSDCASVLAHKLRSVLCAPTRLGDRIEGVVYVDHPFADAAFGPRELRLLEAVASLVALVAQGVRLAGERRRLRREVEVLRAELASATAPPVPTAAPAAAGTPQYALSTPAVRRGQLCHDYEAIVGQHAALVLALQTVDHIVDTEIPVYIHGESGTGKELFARAIHDNGPRKDEPFMTLNCAAVPENLLESELFGHVRGAFTGATADRRGMFEMAHEGTLFLDEVGDMSPGMQSKLLRVLQEGEVRRVGSTRTTKVDVRVLAASHRDLAAMVETGEFRQDVYYRLCAITVTIPPLRERLDDVPLLLEHFLDEESRERGAPPPLVEPEVHATLCSLDWPGNVRQLRNVVRTAWALGGGRVIGAGEVAMALGQPLPTLPPAPRVGPTASSSLPASTAPRVPTGPPSIPGAVPPDAGLSLEDREIAAIHHALRQTGGNKVQAAKVLGISRRTLYRKIDRYGIDA